MGTHVVVNKEGLALGNELKHLGELLAHQLARDEDDNGARASLVGASVPTSAFREHAQHNATRQRSRPRHKDAIVRAAMPSPRRFHTSACDTHTQNGEKRTCEGCALRVTIRWLTLGGKPICCSCAGGASARQKPHARAAAAHFTLAR